MSRNQHGNGGVYSGGDWLPIEDCAKIFDVKRRLNNCKGCPRSCSKTESKREFDVVIIGGGCIGSAIARELSKTSNSILLLEAADDISQGATKGNSGIVHAGYDDEPGTLRAKFCWKGNQMFPQLDRELNFGYQRNGSLVLARGKEDEDHLLDLKKRGETNGVERLRILTKEEVFQLEPHVHPETSAALLSPDAGNLIPYEFAIALAENAAANAVEFRIRREVVGISNDTDSSTSYPFEVTARHWEPRCYVDAVLGDKKKNDNTQDGKKESRPVLVAIFAASVIASAAIILSSAAGVAKNYQQPLSIVLLVGTLIHLAFTYSIAVNIFKKRGASIEANKNAATTTAVNRTVGSGGRLVNVDEMRVGGSGASVTVDGVIIANEMVRTRFVINCAGSAADRVAALVGDTSFKIKPRLGDYLLLHRNQGHLATHTLFPCPGPLGKGVLVQTTLWGNLILGPTARDVSNTEAANMTAEDVQAYILSKCKALVPSFDPKEVIHAFCGSRAKSDRGDWIIEPSKVHPSFINVAGIDSPGLAGSPAIALEVVRLLSVAGLNVTPRPDFNPYRHPIITPKSGWKGLRAGPEGKYTDPLENVVCKCEKVTEAEVLSAIRGPLPVDSTQAIRKRTRAGMGHCQAHPDNYDCESRVANIIARELGIPVEAVGRRPWPATSTLPKRWLEDSDKQRLVELKK